MIVCSNCETAQFLQITASRVRFQNGRALNEVTESYECTMCGATGRLDMWEEDNTRRTTVTGDIEETDDKPEVNP